MRIPFVDDAVLEKLASEFLDKYHPSHAIPLPIEEIVELKMGININLVTNLKEDYDCDGFITGDFKTIIIDGFTFENRIERARFTLAHELGHREIHAGFYATSDIETEEEYLKFQNSFTPQEWKRLEIHADRFAEFILFPNKAVLDQQVEQAVKEMGGIDSLILNDLIQNVAETHQVSSRCAYIKLDRSYSELVAAAKNNIDIPF